MILSQCTTFCGGQILALEIAVVRAVIVGPVMSPETARDVFVIDVDYSIVCSVPP